MGSGAPKVEILSVASHTLSVRVTFRRRTVDYEIPVSSGPDSIMTLEFPEAFYEHLGERCRDLYPVLFARLAAQARKAA